jgi:hypothetical protein
VLLAPAPALALTPAPAPALAAAPAAAAGSSIRLRLRGQCTRRSNSRPCTARKPRYTVNDRSSGTSCMPTEESIAPEKRGEPPLRACAPTLQRKGREGVKSGRAMRDRLKRRRLPDLNKQTTLLSISGSTLPDTQMADANGIGRCGAKGRQSIRKRCARGDGKHCQIDCSSSGVHTPFLRVVFDSVQKLAQCPARYPGRNTKTLSFSAIRRKGAQHSRAARRARNPGGLRQGRARR